MRKLFVVIPISLIAVFLATDATAAGRNVRARLAPTEEVPALSTNGQGVFAATFSVDREELTYELSYADLQGMVAQSHLHLGQRSVNGGISIFLCTNLGNGPPGTQACPPAPATISGTLTAADVIGPDSQGIDAGEWEEIREAIEDGVVYVNVHTDLFPGGEIRGQLRMSRRHGH
ncbi:MAG: CHRD domain-containing protein [Thermoanaerobaculia bacterium]